jgi:beta-lactamase regulating signal transducer with metallopeptidase domain
MNLDFTSLVIAWILFWQDPAPLLNLLLRSAILLGLALAFGRIARATRPETRVLVYRAALACTLGLSLLTLAPRAPSDVSRWNISLYSAAPSEPESQVNPEMATATPVSPSAPAAIAEVAEASKSDSSVIPQKMAPLALGEATPRDNKIEKALNLLMWLWPLVSAWLLARVVWCHIHIMWMRHCATPIDDVQTVEILRAACVATGVKTPRLLRAKVKAPFLCGVWRPAIVMPLDATERFDSSALRAIFGHEAAHIRAHDCAWTYARRIACALLWTQPLLWLLSKQMEIASEEACDLAVLEGGCAPRDYARCLVDLAEFLCLSKTQRALGAGVIPRRSALRHRVEQILKGVPKTCHLTGRARWATALVALAVGTASVAFSVDMNAPLGAVGEISGRVVYPDGKPAAGLGVEVNIQHASELRITRGSSTSRRTRQMLYRSTTTRADGTYRVKNLLAGATFNVMLNNNAGYFDRTGKIEQAGPPGFVGAAQAVTPRRGKMTRIKDIILTRGALIEVRVEDAVSGLPLANMSIGCHGPHRPNSTGFITQGYTDADGRAVLRVPPGRNWVYWNGPVTSRRVEMHLGSSTPHEKDLAIVQSGATLYGASDFVEVRVDGKLSGYTRSGNGGMRDTDAIDLKAGQTRRMTFRLSPLRIKERPGKLPLVKMSQTPPAPGERPVAWNPNFVLPRTATGIIEGRAVVPAGVSLDGAKVQIEMSEAWVQRFADATPDYATMKKLPLAQQKMLYQELKIGSDGSYRFAGLAPANYDISLIVSDRKTSPTSNFIIRPITGVAARENQIVRAPNLIATRGAIISGRVIDAQSGQGLPQVFIPITHRLPGSSRFDYLVDASANGRFTARVLPGKVNLSLNFYSVSLGKTIEVAGHTYDFYRAQIYLDGKLQKRGISLDVVMREGQNRKVEFRLPRLS